ncbi:MAG: CrcB family protein [Acidimicrobiia bacterium]
MTVFVAALTGSVGALARYLLSGALQNRSRTTLPIGTAGVNLLGALLLGLIVGASDGSLLWTAAAGFTGGLSTFSTWMVETIGLGIVPKPSFRAVANLLIVATLGVALAALGYHITN